MPKPDRTEALHTFGVLDAELQQELSGLIELASTVCETPITLVNLLDHTSQITKASKGWDITQIPKEKSFCQYTVRNRDIFIVEDALRDERFMNSEFVQGDPNIRFYAGVPLRTSEGLHLGAICAIDTKPKKLSDSQKDSLSLIAGEVMARFTLHRRERELKAQNKELEDAAVFLQNSSDIQALIDPESKKITKVNTEQAPLAGLDKEYLLGSKVGALIADKQKREQILLFLDQPKLAKGAFSAVVNTENKSKRYFKFNFTYQNKQWYMTARNITKRKQAAVNLKRERKLSDKIINNLPNLFFMYDGEGNTVRWNNKFLESTGYNGQEIAYMGPEDYFPESQKKRIKRKLSEVFEKGEASMEATLFTKDGKKVPYLFNASRFVDRGKAYLLGTGQDVSRQKEYQNKIKSSLKEKETLLSEIHHRVKNNLAVISGLLQLESFQTENEHAKNVLKNSQLRIQSMATVHEILYRSSSFNDLCFGDFVENIVGAIESTFTERTNQITIRCDIEPVKLNINQALPCGLILNELITNAYKHAYAENEGMVRVSIKKEGDNVIMAVEDEGKGIPVNINTEQPSTLGFTLIKNLSQQLEANLSIERQHGTKVTLSFAQEDKKGAASSMSIA